MPTPPIAGDKRQDKRGIDRQRVIEGLLAAVEASGLAAVTIADVARHAGVSKRTFYEHFTDKDDCFVAAYRAVSDQALAALAASIDPALSWDEQLRATTRAYVRVLEERPKLTRTFLLEIHAAGEKAIAARREVHQRFADTLRAFVEVGRARGAPIEPLSAPMATALVGGIHELVLVALESGRPAKLREVASTATDLVRAVLRAS